MCRHPPPAPKAGGHGLQRMEMSSAWSPAPAETAQCIWQLPKTGGFNPESSKPQEPLQTPAILGALGTEPPPSPGVLLRAPDLGRRSPRECPSLHRPHRHIKEKKKGLFAFKLQNSSLEPSANSGNLLYSCLDLFLYIFFFKPSGIANETCVCSSNDSGCT